MLKFTDRRADLGPVMNRTASVTRRRSASDAPRRSIGQSAPTMSSPGRPRTVRSRTSIVALAAVVIGAPLVACLSGCGVAVNKARGQRNRASLISAVLQREEVRLTDQANSGVAVDPAEFERLVNHYQELVTILQKSGSGVPRWRQQAEWELVDLAEAIRDLPGYETWSPQERETFETQFARNELKKRQLR